MKSKSVLLLAVLLVASAAGAQTYLAIGDSLGFGFQEAKFYSEVLSGTYDPASFNTGFVDVLTSQIHTIAPNAVTVNFSCPGETTTSAFSGGCPLHNTLISFPLHQDYPPSMAQMQAVLNYLIAHPGQVWMVTITLGANDILNFLSNCGGNSTCIQQGLPALIANTSTNIQGVIAIIKLAAPNALIVWTNVPDPYLFTDPANVPTFQTFNTQVGAAAASSGAKVVDWFGAQQSLDQATFCTLDFVCWPPLNDIHPTDLGYTVLGYQVLQALF